MYHIPVFAGLGSDSLFACRTLDTAACDATLPESEILLQACHRVFLAEIAKAIQTKILSPSIDLEDFKEPQSLIRPHERYHQDVTVQHSTLFLIQLLRYIRHTGRSSSLLGVAGFCAGLLPAVTVGNSKNIIELLARSQQFYYVALWLGIRSEAYKQDEVTRNPCQPSLPWSVVIDGLSPKHAEELLIQNQMTVRLSSSLSQIHALTSTNSQISHTSISAPSIRNDALL